MAYCAVAYDQRRRQQMKHVLQRARRQSPNIVLTLDLEETSVVESAASHWEHVWLLFMP